MEGGQCLNVVKNPKNVSDVIYERLLEFVTNHFERNFSKIAKKKKVKSRETFVELRDLFWLLDVPS